VFIDTERAVIADGKVSCGDGVQRVGTVLRTFSQGANVVRFSES
jgi:hypothetical protein